MKPEHIRKISTLEDKLRQMSASFSQTREMVRLNSDPNNRGSSGYSGVEVALDMKDLLVIGAMTNSGILITGKSGGGKSHLAKMAMNAFFGSEGYCDKTITPGMNEEAFIDIDFGKIKDGKTLKEAIGMTPILTYPGVILDEVNRAPPVIQNVFIPYLDFKFNIKGLDFPVGLKLPNGNGGRYQYRILTINEGAEYKGTSAMDRAVRDRMPIEIPIDNFRSLKQDIRDMVKHRKSSSLTVADNNESLTDLVLDLCNDVTKIPISAMAAELLVYLSGLSNCIKSCTGLKEGIAFNLDLCRGCHHAAVDENVCGNVYSPTNRSLINLETIARGTAALRAYKTLVHQIENLGEESKKRKTLNEFMKSKYLEELRVECPDILTLAPFILYSKMQINEPWVQKHFQGNRFLAVKTVIDKAYERFSGFYKEHQAELLKSLGQKNEKSMTEFLRKYAEEKDSWMANIKDFENKATPYSQETGNIIGLYKED